ncbi:PQQ-binding-like beta-propeller repeat protein [Opitutales bacterium]|nr:PQQ-binding-like beta-propeller repeat protein [Opitutales bacterium]
MATALAYTGAANPTTHWETPYSTGGTIFSSPAIATDGTVYIGSNDNKLHAINSDGSAKWTFTTGDWVDSTPAIGADGTVYFGSWDNQLYAVNPTDGSKLWDFNTSSSIIASPAIGVDGRIYFGSKDEFFYALESNGSLAWESYIGNPIASSAALGQDGTIYFGDENGTFHARNQDGSEKWSYSVDVVTDMNNSILSSPAIDLSGNLYFGSGNGFCYSIADNGTSASLNWKFATSDRVDASPVLGENNEVFFVSRDGYLRSLDTNTGIANWEVFSGDVFYSSPTVDLNGRVYVIGYTGFGENHLFAYNSNGTKAWDTNNSSSLLNIGGLVDSSLALDGNGNLFFGCFDNKVYSVNVGSGIAQNAWPQLQRNNARTGAWPSYSINVNIMPTGAGEVNGTGIYNQGATANLAVISNSNDGYSFGYWSGDKTSSDNPLSIEMNSNINLTANFGLNAYVLSVNAGIGGSVIGSGNVAHGTMAAITATPDNGYSFSGWNGEAVTDPSSASTTVNMTQARTVTAIFSKNSYFLNVNISPINGGTVEGNGTYQHGDEVSLQATSNSPNGYLFGYWSGSMIGNDNPLTFQIVSDINLTANFGLTAHSLMVQANNGGNASGSGNIIHGKLASINATANTGYAFNRWTGDGVTEPFSASTTVNMTQARSVTANFSPLDFSINALAGPGGTINDINGTYSYDSNISIIATPNVGYSFLNWTQSGSGIVDTTASSTIISVDRNQSIQANFSPINYDLNLTISIGGTVNSSPASNPQPYNTQVSLIAIPEEGYSFLGWQGEGIADSNASSTTISMTGNRNISALFAINIYDLKIAQGNGGVTTGTGSFSHGGHPTISATPQEGYSFIGWRGKGIADSNASSTTISMTEDRNISALFAINIYDLKIAQGNGGVATGMGSFSHGGHPTISATPQEGYSFIGWQGEGIADSNASSTTISMTGNRNISALFSPKLYRLIIEAKENGIVSEGGTFAYGTHVAINAFPNSGFIFSGWNGQGVTDQNESSTTVIMNQDHNATAYFTTQPISSKILGISSSPMVGGTTLGAGSYTNEDNASISAVPLPGYSFDSWAGDGVTNHLAQNTTVNMDQDRNISASFSINSYNLTINPSTSGTVNGAGTFSFGSLPSISAVPLPGYSFDSWAGDGVTNHLTQNTTVNMDQDRNISAVFSITPLTSQIEVLSYGNEWYASDWFGYFYQSKSGWCYHYDLGWVYPEIQSNGSIWLWSPQLKWIWMNSSSYTKHFAWSATENNWIYFNFQLTLDSQLYSYQTSAWRIWMKD